MGASSVYLLLFVFFTALHPTVVGPRVPRRLSVLAGCTRAKAQRNILQSCRGSEPRQRTNPKLSLWFGSGLAATQGLCPRAAAARDLRAGLRAVSLIIGS